MIAPQSWPIRCAGFAAAQRADQRRDVGDQRCLVVIAVARNFARRIAAKPWRHYAVAGGGERWHLVAPRFRGIRKAVQQQHQRAFAVFQVGKFDAVCVNAFHHACRSGLAVSAVCEVLRTRVELRGEPSIAVPAKRACSLAKRRKLVRPVMVNNKFHPKKQGITRFRGKSALGTIHALLRVRNAIFPIPTSYPGRRALQIALIERTPLAGRAALCGTSFGTGKLAAPFSS